MGICKKFLKKGAKNAAVAYAGYQLHDYVDSETQIVVKPNIYLPEKSSAVSIEEIVLVIVIIVAIAILAVFLKYIVKGITSRKNRIQTNTIPLYQHHCKHTRESVNPTAPSKNLIIEVEKDN